MGWAFPTTFQRGKWKGLYIYMNYKAHIIVGFIVVGVLLLSSHYQLFKIPEINWVIMIPIIVGYAIIADIDHKQGVARTLAYVLGLMAIIASVYMKQWIAAGAIAATLLFLIVGTKHRGFTHSILFCAIISVPLFFYFGYIYAIVGFVVGCSHLLADGIIIQKNNRVKWV